MDFPETPLINIYSYFSHTLYFRPDSTSTRGTSSSGGDHRISPSKSASLGRPSRPRTAPPNRASSKSSRSESAHPVSDTGAIKRQDTVDARKSQQQLSTTSALGKEIEIIPTHDTIHKHTKYKRTFEIQKFISKYHCWDFRFRYELWLL